MRRKNILIHGVAINDSDHLIGWDNEGRSMRCPFYETWIGMIRRCYSKVVNKRNESYSDCSVCEEWIRFSNFESWMRRQDWHGKDLDKDIIAPGNKIYSPENCCFVDGKVNRFLARTLTTKKEYPIGASFHKGVGKFQDNCNNPFTNKSEYLGVYDCPKEAHLAWKRRKHQFACELASQQKDERIANALRLRYL